MLRLTKKIEFDEVRIGDTVFRPRLLSYSADRKLIREHSHNGRLDADGYDAALWDYMLGDEGRPDDKPGWERLADEDEQELPYSADKVPHVIERMPRAPLELILAAALLPKRVHEEQEKNSSASSGNEAAGTTPSDESSGEEA